jgi:hypothetical protein
LDDLNRKRGVPPFHYVETQTIFMNHKNPLADLNGFANFNQLAIDISRTISELELSAGRNRQENAVSLFSSADLRENLYEQFKRSTWDGMDFVDCSNFHPQVGAFHWLRFAWNMCCPFCDEKDGGTVYLSSDAVRGLSSAQ